VYDAFFLQPKSLTTGGQHMFCVESGTCNTVTIQGTISTAQAPIESLPFQKR